VKKYCVDTSGLSNPVAELPQDIYTSLWQQVIDTMQTACMAVTYEIYDEMINIPGDIGQCIRDHKSAFILEVNQDSWDWQSYLTHSNRMNKTYERFISEYNGNIKGTVGINDISIIALAKTLNLPVVSMEKRVNVSSKKQKIPDICDREGIQHLTFIDFLRNEGIKA
jgi:hypothetical protein